MKHFQVDRILVGVFTPRQKPGDGWLRMAWSTRRLSKRVLEKSVFLTRASTRTVRVLEGGKVHAVGSGRCIRRPGSTGPKIRMLKPGEIAVCIPSAPRAALCDGVEEAVQHVLFT